MTVIELAKMKPKDRGDWLRANPNALPVKGRIAYVQAHEHEARALNASQLDALGRLLCHESDEKSREQSPIVGDYRPSKQQRFDDELFGNGEDLQPTYVADRTIS